ncbi:septal ring lytic transglycosylase RlpA family protein [Marinomonas agarivorans]|nr:septal ring lytic transglycosylase RlpA family protein [Marinomonas agarivorans]
MMLLQKLILLSLAFLLVACAGTNFKTSQSKADYAKLSGNGRYSILQDHGPEDDAKLKEIPDLVPKKEPRSRAGNKSPYVVWGKKYWVMDSAEGFTQTGMASWYGKKFHGHKTSNGEIYDMYSYSAAHKNLPIPTYLRVTNLDNNLEVIVRVNDRGPFHDDRIIDLSYAAAAKLDYHKKGLARVKIEVVSAPTDVSVGPSNWYSLNRNSASPAAKSTNTANTGSAVLDQSYAYKTDGITVAPPAYNPEEIFTHLQLGAFEQLELAQRLKQKVINIYGVDTNVFISEQKDRLYKVVMGPYEDNYQMNSWSDRLQRKGFERPVRVNLLP